MTHLNKMFNWIKSNMGGVTSSGSGWKWQEAMAPSGPVKIGHTKIAAVWISCSLAIHFIQFLLDTFFVFSNYNWKLISMLYDVKFVKLTTKGSQVLKVHMLQPALSAFSQRGIIVSGGTWIITITIVYYNGASKLACFNFAMSIIIKEVPVHFDKWNVNKNH